MPSKNNIVAGMITIIIAGAGVWYWQIGSILSHPVVFTPYDGISFMYKGSPISPSCLFATKEETYEKANTIYLSECTRHDLKTQVSTSTYFIKDGESFEVVYPPEVDATSGYSFSNGRNAYEIVGQRGNEYIIVGVSNGGGTGNFTSLASFELNGDVLTFKKQLVGIGDRCNGGIVNTELTSSGVLVGSNLTPFDIINLVASSSLQAYLDLNASAASCYAVEYDLIDPDTNSNTFRYLELHDKDLGESDEYSYQGCFNQLQADTLALNKQKMQLRQLHTFAKQFFTQCTNGEIQVEYKN